MTAPNIHARDYLIICGAHMEITSVFLSPFSQYEDSAQPVKRSFRNATHYLLRTTLEKNKGQKSAEKRQHTGEATKSSTRVLLLAPTNGIMRMSSCHSP